jgi:DNA polymerase epsilon subunit 2
MPPVHFDPIRGGFTTSKSKASIAGQASSRAAYLRERWGIIKEIILRNENFTPPAIGGHDRSAYLKLTSTRNLLGRAGQLFLLFGMLSRNPEGKLCLEDGEGRVPLDMEDAVSLVNSAEEDAEAGVDRS